MKQQAIYEVVSENLSNLGRMGSYDVYDNWRRYFSDIEKAKDKAEMDYGGEIDWNKTEQGFSSGDLGHVLYQINKLEIE